MIAYRTLASFLGVNVQEEEEDCQTEATTPTSFEPVSQSQMSTEELEESSPEEVTPAQEEVSSAGEIRTEEENRAIEPQVDAAQPQQERDSEKTEEPQGDTDSDSHSVDELLADWREDLEAFKQMEKDEL